MRRAPPPSTAQRLRRAAARDRLEAAASILPGAVGIDSMGRPTWVVGARPFAVVEATGGGFGVGVYVPDARVVAAWCGVGARPAGAAGWWIVDETVEEDGLVGVVEAAWRSVAPRRLILELERQRSSIIP